MPTVAACATPASSPRSSHLTRGNEITRFDGTIAVIGGGKMGEALAGGWIRSGAVQAGQITIAEPDGSRRDSLARALPGVVLADSAQAAVPCDLVLLAVKPQVLDKVLASIAQSLEGALIVSIAAGWSCAKLESQLPAGSKVVRVMPNTPALVGAGMALVSAGTETDAEELERVRSLFSAVGSAIVIDERYQNAGTAISGSGPAYFALVVDSLARAGVAAGLTRDVAQLLAIQTMAGTAQLLAETGMHPSELIDGVTSPGGTTIAALNELEAAGLRAAFSDAVAVAVARAEELGS